MKVRVRMQRASSARESGFWSSSLGLRTSKEIIDRAKNLLDILKHLAVPESKHTVSLRLEKRCANFIFFGALDVLCAIQFNDEPPFSRAEISEVRPNRELSAKFGATHLARSQMMPQDSFGVGLLAPQASSVLLGRFDRAHRFECSRSVGERQERRKEQNPDSRAKYARCKRTLTFILSLTGRGNRNTDAGGKLTVSSRLKKEISLRRASETILLSPLPVRERMKVRVLLQCAFFSARFKILSSYLATNQ
jgi:hypothetical protein